MDYFLLLTILSLGMAIPTSMIVLISIYFKATAGDNYSLDMKSMSRVYFIALLSWSVFFSILLGGN